MAYRLEVDEELSAGLERIAREELDGALHELTAGVEEDEVRAVHEARKCLKKERALLRLVRGAVPRKTRRSENVRLRDAGRQLSSTRDAQVALQTVDGLAERYAGRLSKAAFARIRRAVKADAGADGAGEAVGVAAAAVVDELEAARAAVAEWAPRARRWKDVEPGLARTYGEGRAALAVLGSRPGDEEWHAWRKRVKDLWYHQRVLEPLWPAAMSFQSDVLDDLGQLLGDDQDLANVRATLGSVDLADVGPLLELIDARREELHGEALALGRRVYAERPKAFIRRHRAYSRESEKARAAPS